MPRKSTLPPDAPVWITEDRRIDEMTFACSFLEAYPMKCVHGKLYAGTYHLSPDNNIYRGKGKRCRGYRGVEVIDHDNPFLE